ncbi:SDR family oxidoreductase [Nocardia miyunensis]|uniref:SDR family oxidoreductase n=1 Tax=Nocardia miyunensis TaxID=282684 RepID=UPI0008341674
MIGALLRPLPSARRAAMRIRLSADEPISGKRIVVTGGSSGIGRATATRLAELGGEIVLVARRQAELDLVRDEVVRAGGRAHALACDLTDPRAVEQLAAEITDRCGSVDILINNAGRSIRRTVDESFGRLHDFERTMAVNYFGPVGLTLALLPSMLERGRGHIINVATWGVPAGTMPKFAAYHGSKSALTAFGRSLAAETAARGIHVTTLHFPLVHTPMTAPTADYRSLPALSPSAAAEWMITAIRTKPTALRPAYVSLIRAAATISPTLADSLVFAAT